MRWFRESEVDAETGVVAVLDYAAIGDVGDPRGRKSGCSADHARLNHAQRSGGPDQQCGVARGRYQNKPPTILDAPRNHRRRP
jgi:hypothetical protein